MSETSKGVYIAKKKNGDIYYRASFTYKNKHISLGSSDDIETASLMYDRAKRVLHDLNLKPIDYEDDMIINNESLEVRLPLS